MKKINVTKKDLVLGAALVIFCFVLGALSAWPVEASNMYTDEYIMNEYIDIEYGEESIGALLEDHCDDEYIVYLVYDGERTGYYTTLRDYMIQYIERGN